MADGTDDAADGPDEPIRGVTVTGPPDAPPVVFVHGVMFTRAQWAPQRAALAGEFRVVTPDLPGHGVRSGDPFRMERALAVVDEAVERVAGGGAHVVGLSLGGYVATLYASRHPEKVDSLVVSDSSANPVGPFADLTRLVSIASNVVTGSRLVRRGVEWLLARGVRARGLPADVEAEIVDAGFFPRQFGLAGVELAGTDVRSAFAEYDGRALVLNGKWDLVMRLGEDAHADAADAGLAVIDGAGHTSNLDRPHAYSDAIRRFLRADRRLAAPAGRR
jgi:pimeloyl-ACP methyl ester carboxylesterase